jgi:ribosomal protein L37AE/L43A
MSFCIQAILWVQDWGKQAGLYGIVPQQKDMGESSEGDKKVNSLVGTNESDSCPHTVTQEILNGIWQCNECDLIVIGCTHLSVENLWDGVDHSTDRWECLDCGFVFEEEPCG